MSPPEQKIMTRSWAKQQQILVERLAVHKSTHALQECKAMQSRSVKHARVPLQRDGRACISRISLESTSRRSCARSRRAPACPPAFAGCRPASPVLLAMHICMTSQHNIRTMPRVHGYAQRHAACTHATSRLCADGIVVLYHAPVGQA